MNLFPNECEKSVSNRQIIIIDDDDRYRFALKRKLSMHGFANLRLEKAPPPSDAFYGSGACDLVLLDIHFDDTDCDETDGIAVLSAYRKSGMASQIVMVSGDESPNTFVRALRQGADDYWVKGMRLDIAYEISALFSRERRNFEGAISPLDVIALGYLRTLNLTPEEIEALALSAERLVTFGEPSPESPLFTGKRQLWRMVHQIFRELMIGHFSGR